MITKLRMSVVPAIFISTSIYSQQVYTGDNGITASGSGTSRTVSLGGTLNSTTTIDLGASYHFNFQKSTANYFSILNNGNIGIGASPQTRLDIVTGVGDGTVNETNSLRLRSNDVFGNAMTLQLGVSNVGSGGMNQGYSYIQGAYWGGSYNNPLKLNPKGGAVTVGAVSGGNYWGFMVSDKIVVEAPAQNGHSLGGTFGFSPGSNASLQASIQSVFDKSQWYMGVGMVFNTVGGSDVSGSNGLERMRISSDGNVGIGISAPTAQLHTSGTVTLENFKNNVAEDKYLTTDIDGKLKLKTGSPGGGSGNWTVNGSNISNSNIGFVGIGTSTSFVPTDQDLKLAVNGNIHAKKLKITQGGWADYVFHKNYDLLPLSTLEKYIQENNHLPEVPSTAEVEKNGIDVGDNQVLLLKKVEELTLYLIDQNKKIEQQQQEINELKKLVISKK